MKRPLSQTSLKLMACITMLLDHLGYAFIHQPYGLYALLRIVGRLSFPIYCFLITEGVSHTKNPVKYLLRLGILAILSEPFFDLMCFGRLSIAKQSVMLTLMLGAVMCLAMEKLPKFWMKLLAFIPFYFVAPYLRSDYGSNGILFIAMFMLTQNLPWKELWRLLLMGGLCLYMGGFGVRVLGFTIPSCWFAFLSIVPILFYSGQKGSANKWQTWAMNLFYPAHLAVIAAIMLLMR